MTVETISEKINNIDYTLQELVKAINKANQETINYVILALTVFAVAIIVSQFIYIAFLKKMQKQLVKQNEEIKELKEKIETKDTQGDKS